jgi:replicative DNA helicase
VPEAKDHAKVILSAIIPNRRDLLDKALLHLNPAHFPEKLQSNLFQLLERYADITGAVITRSALEDMLRKKDRGQAELYLETYDLYEETEVIDSDFAWSIQELRELAALQATDEVITDAREILKSGKQLSTGETVQGHNAAREYLLESFSNIDRDLTMQEAPEGDMREESTQLLQDYAERKRQHEQGTSGGIKFGIADLDAKIGGMQNGELILAAGYSSDGKTTLCVQAAWSAAIEQGKNVVFFTTETLRPQVMRKLLSRHSKLPIFGIPDGLNTRDLKAGTLNDAGEAKLQEVIQDFTKNPSYGRLYIAQVPRSSTITSVEQRMYRLQRKFHIDFVVMDYLALLVSDRKRQTAREELAAIMKEAKQVSTTFDDGRGVPFLSPWQVSRAAREAAEKIEMYTSASLSETAEATNSSDVIVSLFAPTDNTDRYVDVTMQVLKNRDGETANSLLTSVDYATSWFRSKAQFDTALTGSSLVGAGGLDSLID